MQIHRMKRDKNQKLILFTLKEMGAELEPVAINLNKLAEFRGRPRMVHNSLKELKEDGLITVTDGTGKAPNAYKLHLDPTT